MNTTYQNDEDEDILIEQQNKGFSILPFVFLLLIVPFVVMLYIILNRDLDLDLDNMIEADDIFSGRTMDITTLNKINRANAMKKINTLKWIRQFNKSKKNMRAP